MDIDESKLSKQSKVVLDLLRSEMAAGMLKPEEVKFVAQALKLKDSIGILGNFIIKLAAFLLAITAVTSWWPKK